MILKSIQTCKQSDNQLLFFNPHTETGLNDSKSVSVHDKFRTCTIVPLPRNSDRVWSWSNILEDLPDPQSPPQIFIYWFCYYLYVIIHIGNYIYV